MKNWMKISLVILVILINALLAYQPHFSYKYPLLGDEYVHISYTKYILEEHKLPFVNPYLYTNDFTPNFEFGFHIFLASIFLILPGDPILIYKYFVILFMIINSILLFYLVNLWFKDFYTALISMLFFGTIQSTSDFLANQYFIPLTTGVALLLLSFIFFHKWVIRNSLKYIFYLIITLVFTLITYPPALFFFIGTMLLYVLSMNHSLHERFSLTKKQFFWYFLSLVILVGIIFIAILNFLSLFDRIIFSSTWTPIQSKLSPIFFLGIIPIVFAAIGLINTIFSKKSKVIVYWILLSIILMYIFYIFRFSILVPFRRLFMFYLIGISILSGIGTIATIQYSNKFFDKKYIKIIAPIALIALIGFQYNSVMNNPIIYNKILNDNLYDSLKFLKKTYTSKTIVAADGLTSLAVYPTSGDYVVGLIESNIGGGNVSTAYSILNEECSVKKQNIDAYVYNFLIADNNNANLPLILLSEKEQNCDFLNLIYDKGPYLYEGFKLNFNLLHIGNISGNGSPSFLDFSTGIDVVEDIAIISSRGNDRLLIFNVSDRTNPALISNFYREGISRVIAEDDLVYVITFNDSLNDDSLLIFNISNPSNINLIGNISNAGPPNFLQDPRNFFKDGDVIYVASSGDNTLASFNVSDARNIVHLGNISGSGNPNFLKFIWDVSVENDIAYISSSEDHRLVIVNATDKKNLELITTVDLSEPPFSFNSLNVIEVKDDIVYLTDCGNSLVSFDVSNPSNPKFLDKINGTKYPNFLACPNDLDFSEKFEDILFVSALYNEAIVLVDISDPSNLKISGFVIGSGAKIDVSGNYIYAVSFRGNALTIFEIQKN